VLVSVTERRGRRGFIAVVEWCQYRNHTSEPQAIERTLSRGISSKRRDAKDELLSKSKRDNPVTDVKGVRSLG